MRIRTLVFGMVLLVACDVAVSAGLADKLPAAPCGIGRPASDRAWWGEWAKTAEAATAIREAEASLKTPMPAFDRERYLDYVTNGDRTRYQEINSRRWDRLKHLVIGECLEGKARFVPAISETAASLCSDPSWVLPAHDHGARILKGANPYVDLAAATNGYQMALSAWLLDGILPAETKKLMLENVASRVTGPVLRTIDGTAPKDVVGGNWWAKANMNWNAVCTAGFVGAILATEPSREIRAKAVEWAVGNMQVFLSGFGRDGYCTEGIGYWNYGFGHFAVLEELLREQTGGQIDLFKAPSVRTVAAAPGQLEIAADIFPAFADCPANVRPDPHLLELISWRLAGQPFTGTPSRVLAESPMLYQTLLELTVRREAKSAEAADRAALPLRSNFPESGVWVVRPATADGMAVAWKGGSNGEHHNHNDVGTTTVVWKMRAVIADPGAMVYRAETFSKDRYRLPILGSFGHSVPVVAGSLQQEGGQCRGNVLASAFTDARDTVTIDFSSAYPGSGLKKLERQWIYQRDGSASLTIEDRFGFAKASAFSTALVGFGNWYLVDGGGDKARFMIDGGAGAVLQVDVGFSGTGAWDVCKMNNPGKASVSRLGLSLVQPAAEGFIRMVVRPAAAGLPAKRAKLPVGSGPDKLDDAHKAPASVSL